MEKLLPGTIAGNLKYGKKGENADINVICDILCSYLNSCLKASENNKLAKSLFENYLNIPKILKLVSKIKDCVKNNDIVKLSRLIGVLAGQEGKSIVKFTIDISKSSGQLIEEIEEGLKNRKKFEEFEGNIKEIYSKIGIKFESEKSIKEFSKNWGEFRDILKNVSKNVVNDSTAIENIISDLNILNKSYSKSSIKNLSKKINFDALEAFKNFILEARTNGLIEKKTYSQGIKIIENDSFGKENFKKYIKFFLKEIRDTFASNIESGKKCAKNFNEKLSNKEEMKKLSVKFRKIDLNKIKNRKYIEKVLENIEVDYSKVSKKTLDKKEKFATELNKNIRELRTIFKSIKSQKKFILTAKDNISSILSRLFNKDNSLIKFIKQKFY